MNTIKSFFLVAVFMTAGYVFGQTSQATFADNAAVWKQVGSQFVSEFTLVADQASLNEIKQKYDGLGNDVSYIVKNSNGNTHTIEMKFSLEIHKSYMYKMLLFIGCETVVIAGNQMTLENFSNLLNQ